MKTYKNSAFEIRINRVNETPNTSEKMDRPKGAYDYWKNIISKASWFDAEKECFVVLLLNTRHKPIAHSLVSVGLLNECMAHPREIFRPAIAAGAYALICMHNHPSGDPQPSEPDRRITRRLVEAGTLLQMPVVDHVIIGEEGIGESSPYFSFREAGLV
jgi:DNA repair protein RadC